jgi:hypothetical protein
LDGLGFDVIDKIYVVYERGWWDAGVEGFQLLWPLGYTLHVSNLILTSAFNKRRLNI